MGAPLPVSSECQHVHATRWPRQEKLFFLPAFVVRTLTPRSQKFVCGLLLGCRSGLDAGPFEKLFLAMLKPKNRAKIFTVCSGPASQSIGVVELVAREPALIFLFAKVENGVTKSCQILRRKNRKNAILA